MNKSVIRVPSLPYYIEVDCEQIKGYINMPAYNEKLWFHWK